MYSFHELYGGHPAQDRVRGQRIPSTDIVLDSLGTSVGHFCADRVEEAFTSENWIVRIYQVKKEDSLGRDPKAVTAWEAGKRLKRSKSATGGGKKGRASM